MKTVKEVSKLAGVSIRMLHHYDAIGLLKPTQVTEAGYRLYGDEALERLYRILMYRELGLSLKEIGHLLDATDSERNRVLEQQIYAMQGKVAKLQNRINLASVIKTVGVNYMDFKDFNHERIDEYSQQAKTLYGKTNAYQEYAQKAKHRTPQQEKELGSQVMDFFVRLGRMRPCQPDCEAAQNWAKELQAFFTEHYYHCTPQIFKCLAESYAGGGSMNENIDKAGGDGTGAFAKQVIDLYVSRL